MSIKSNEQLFKKLSENSLPVIPKEKKSEEIKDNNELFNYDVILGELKSRLKDISWSQRKMYFKI